MIVVRGGRKVFAHPAGGAPVVALDGLDLTFAAGAFTCLVGPSGCGKTTLLKAIAGLTPLDAGDILIADRRVTGPGPDRAVVFQHGALLPWATVLANVGFGLSLRGVPQAEWEATAARLVADVGLSGFERHYPGQLSGGMQQRVGLARALAVAPEILLMDEPFSAADEITRRSLQDDLLALHHRSRLTVVFVTHSIDEAVRLGDRVVLMTARPGRVAEVVDVDLPRPRPDGLDADARFAALKAHLWDRLRTRSAP